MASVVTTSIVVQFSRGEDGGVFSVEVDGREVADGGLNGGRSSFLPGDTVKLLLFKSANTTVDYVEASLGALTTQSATVFVKVQEDLTFANETEASLSKPTTGLSSVVWLGRNLGTLALSGDSKVVIPAPSVGDYAVGVARVVYYSQAHVYTLTHSSLAGVSEYPIVALFIGSST
jgi:hypothetical protein